MIAEVALFPETASTTAAEFNHVLFFLFALCGSVAVVVMGLMVYFCIRYRRRPGDTTNPPATQQSHLLEWAWTLLPLVIFMFVFVWGVEVYFEAFYPPEDATPVYVIGKQWMWKFQHPEGQREINVLHVPKGRPIQLIMTSQDVIHGMFIPAFRVHMDVLPGRYTSFWFRATKVGTYHLFCAQYCGSSHGGMIGRVVVMEPKDYERWLRSSAEGSLGMQGRKVFLKYRCVSCHSADENARAPVLESLYGHKVHLEDGRTVIADAEYIRESVQYPSRKIVFGWKNIMPSFKDQLDEEEIFELIAFLQSLGPGQTPKRVESFPPPATTPPIDP